MSSPTSGTAECCGQVSSIGPFEPNLLFALPPRPPRSPQKSSKTVTSSEQPCQNEGSITCCRVPNEPRRLDNTFMRDVIIGFADGLTVPFALTAGLSSLGSSHLVVIGGLAELFSGAISMGVGGYFATKSERDNYRYLLRRTRIRVENSCSAALEREVLNILGPYGLDSAEAEQIVQRLQNVDRNAFEADDKDSGNLTAFLLRFGQGVEAISTWQLYASAATIGLSYMIGGLIPMIPYFIIHSALKALFVSIGITALVLLLFGALKCYLTGSQNGPISIVVSALQTLVVGALAAGASYGIVRALDTNGIQ